MCGSSSSPAPARRSRRGADVTWMARTIRLYARRESSSDAMAASRMFARDRHAAGAGGRPCSRRAFGGGAGLAAVCDIVVAEEGAVFGFTEVRLGHSAGGDLAIRAREDRPIGGARAVSHRRALLRGPRTRDRPCPCRGAARVRSTPRLTRMWARSSAAGPEAIAPRPRHSSSQVAGQPIERRDAGHGRGTCRTPRLG